MKQKFSKNAQSKVEFRINDEIVDVKECRVIGDNIDSQIMSFADALKLAESMEMDLIEINHKANPPIMRIAPYDKFLYELKKKTKATKQQVTQVKEIQLKPNIAENDLNTKARKASEFLSDGHKVKVVLTLKGRQLMRREENKKPIYQFLTLLEKEGIPESMPKDEGNRTIAILKPIKK